MWEEFVVMDKMGILDFRPNDATKKISNKNWGYGCRKPKRPPVYLYRITMWEKQDTKEKIKGIINWEIFGIMVEWRTECTRAEADKCEEIIKEAYEVKH